MVKPHSHRPNSNSNRNNSKSDRFDRSSRLERSSKSDRFDRSPRPDHSSKSDRFDRSPKSDRFDHSSKSDRFDRSSRPERSSKTDRFDRSPKSDRFDHSSKSGRFDRSPRLDHSSKSDRFDRSSKSDRFDHSSKSGRFDRSPRPEHSSKTDRFDRSPRLERSSKSDRFDRSPKSDRFDRSSRADRSKDEVAKPIRLRPLSEEWEATTKLGVNPEPEYILPIQKMKEAPKSTALSKLKQLKEVVESGQSDLSDSSEQDEMRINRFLSHCDLGSRREVERLIQQHRVQINGELLNDLGYRVSSTDVVTVDGKVVSLITDHSYIALNKPAGYVVSRRSFPGNPAIYQLLPSKFANFGYAGRLDRESRGLVILSSDGSFIRNISHPRKGVTKRYIVTVDSPIDDSDLKIMTGRGIKDGDDVLRAVSARVIDRKAKKVEVVLTEGKNRQLRRMFESIEYQVVDLQRIAVGRISLEAYPVKEGEYFGFIPHELTSGPIIANTDKVVTNTKASSKTKKSKQSQFLEE